MKGGFCMSLFQTIPAANAEKNRRKEDFECKFSIIAVLNQIRRELNSAQTIGQVFDALQKLDEEIKLFQDKEDINNDIKFDLLMLRPQLRSTLIHDRTRSQLSQDISNLISKWRKEEENK